MSLRICVLGLSPNELDHPRHRAILDGLEHAGYTVDIVFLSRWLGALEILREPQRLPALAVTEGARLLWHLPQLRRCDLLFVPAFKPALIPVALVLGNLLRKPVVADYLVGFTDVNEDRRVVTNPRHAALYRRWDAFNLRHTPTFTDTAQHRAVFRQMTGVDTRDMGVIPVGTRSELLGVPPIDAFADTITVQYVGAYIPFHGVDIILHAAARLRHHPRIRFELIGRGQTYAESVKLADDLRLDNVRFVHDYVTLSDFAAILGRGSVSLGVFGSSLKTLYVVPSKVYECLAAGRPVITADSPAVRDEFEPERDLVTVCPGDPDELAAAISRLANAPSEMERLGAAGRAAVQRAYLPMYIGARLRSVIENVVHTFDAKAHGREWEASNQLSDVSYELKPEERSP